MSAEFLLPGRIARAPADRRAGLEALIARLRGDDPLDVEAEYVQLFDRGRGTSLHLDPCIPRAWPRFEIDFRYHSSRYRLVVENPRGAMRGVTEISLDGAPVAGREIPLADDGREHRIAVVLG